MLEGFFRSPSSIVRANGPTECGRYLLRSSLAAALLDGLFEHPAREVAVRRELPKLLGIVSEEGWSGYRSKKDSGHYAATLVSSFFTSTWAKITSGSR